MISRYWQSPADDKHNVDQDLDALILRIRRLAAHRGYDREALMSPMLKRLMPLKRPTSDALADMTELRARLNSAGLDRKALAYLTQSVETELDFARLRLT